MTVGTSIQIPKPSDPDRFEDQCTVLFRQILDDPNIQRYASSGYAQSGVDIIGRRRQYASDHWVGIQCKLTTKNHGVTKKTVRDEAAAALNFDPPLKEYIIATTLDNHRSLQNEALKITQEQNNLGRDFTVQVWDWQTLRSYILQSQDAIDAFTPDAFPNIRKISHNQKELNEKFDELHLTVVRSISPANTLWDDETVESILDQRIEEYKRLLEDGQASTALNLLRKLWDSLPSSADTNKTFRIRVNIAACKLQHGHDVDAAQDYIAAYTEYPTHPKAPAFRVLALTLLGQPEEAWNVGHQARSTAGDKPLLIAQLLNAARQLDHDIDLQELIDPDLSDDPNILYAKLEYLRSRSSAAGWIGLAKSAAEKHPDESNILRLAADARIASALDWFDNNERRPLPTSISNDLLSAADVLHNEWKNLERVETCPDAYAEAICANLSTAYRLLNDLVSATRVIDDGRRLLGERNNLIHTRFALALEQGDAEGARSLINQLPDSRDATFGCLQLFANTGDWDAILELSSRTDLHNYHDSDQAKFESLILIARYEKGQLEDPRAAADTLLERYPNEIDLPILLHGIARRRFDQDWRTELFRQALDRSATLDRASRIMLAFVAEYEGDPETIIDVLDGFVDVTKDSDELRLLTQAFASARPRKASLKFASSLSQALIDRDFYAQRIAAIYFKSGALPEAERTYHQAIKNDSNSLSAHMGLISSWIRQERHDLVSEHIANVDPFMLEGTAEDRMALAQVLVEHDRSTEAAEFGYQTVIDNRDNVVVLQRYIGLFLPDSRSDLIPSLGQSVSEDAAIELETGNGEIRHVVIERGPARPSIEHYPPDHPLSQAILGRRIGDVASLNHRFGSSEEFRIRWFKHKYLALLHNIMNTIQSRFPDEAQFYQFKLEDDDVSPILEHVKEFGKQQEGIFEQYEEARLPLGVAASLVGKTTPEFAELLLRQEKSVRAFAGDLDAFHKALSSLSRAGLNCAVFDTYTAWIVHALDLTPLLNKIFAKLVVPQTVLDELRHLRETYRIDSEGKPLRALAYVNGQYLFEEIDSDNLEAINERISSCIEAIQAHFDIVPAAAPGRPSDFEQELAGLGSRCIFDAGYAAVNENGLLVSEDANLRDFFALCYEIPEEQFCWLQPVLLFALDKGVISPERYVTVIFDLALRRHYDLFLNLATLVKGVEIDERQDMLKFQALAQCLGSGYGDWRGHLELCWAFVNFVFANGVPRTRWQKAAGIVVDRMVSMLREEGYLGRVLPKMLKVSTAPLALRVYLYNWAKGHFLDVGDGVELD